MWQAKTHRKAKCYGGDVDVVDRFWLRLLGSARPGCQHEGRDGILRASGAAVRLRGPAEKNPGKAISVREINESPAISAEIVTSDPLRDSYLPLDSVGFVSGWRSQYRARFNLRGSLALINLRGRYHS